jgi:site-specific recombinase XerD
MHLDGIRVFYERTLKRPWPVVDLVRPRKTQTLPVVLSLQEVRSRLAVGEHLQARMGLRRIDACGLRLREGPPLQVSDLEAQRLLGRVRQGNGGQDRVVPRAPRVLEW